MKVFSLVGKLLSVQPTSCIVNYPSLFCCYHYTVCLKAGCDLELTAFGRNNRYALLGPLLKEGNVTKDEVMESAKRLFFTRMSLGEFDPPHMNPWNNISIDVVQSREHLQLAEDIAAKGFVLLKNDDGFLPIDTHKTEFFNVAMVGPFANNGPALVGDYAHMYDDIKFSYPSEVAKWLTKSKSTVVNGCIGKVDSSLAHCEKYNQTEVVGAVKDAELILLAMGTGPGIEAEFRDRPDLHLPGKQVDIISDVVKNAPEGAKIILLLFNAGPLQISHALEHHRITAIIECFFPGQTAGGAIYRVLTGEVNPAARLPNTWYADMKQVPPMTNYSMEGRTYKYLLAVPLFPFGFGLSYTHFHYNKVEVSPRVFYGCEYVYVDVELHNDGERDGDEVIQIYLKPVLSKTDPTLLHKLVTFERVSLRAGEIGQYRLHIPHSSIAVWKNGSKGWNYYIEPDEYMIFVGGQQPGQRMFVPSNVIEKVFSYIGSEILLDECEK